MRTMRGIALLLVLVIAVGCGGKDSPTGPSNDGGSGGSGNNSGNNNPVTLANGSLSATLDGNSFVASSAIVAVYSNGLLAISGGNTTGSIGFALLVQSPGTYTVSATTGLNFQIVSATATPTSWSSQVPNGVGTLTLTSLSATGAAGTFSFTATPAPGSAATGTRTVTNGRFDVKF